MTPQDIQVGQFYHLNPCPIEFLGTVFMGCGMRKLFTDDEYVFKHLIIVHSDDRGCVGKLFQEGENAREGLWECLEEYPGNISLTVIDS